MEVLRLSAKVLIQIDEEEMHLGISWGQIETGWGITLGGGGRREAEAEAEDIKD